MGYMYERATIKAITLNVEVKITLKFKNYEKKEQAKSTPSFLSLCYQKETQLFPASINLYPDIIFL